MKIGIFQDLHANFPALKKAIEVFRKANCAKIVHVGDLIGIGPYPKECLEYSLSIKEMEFVMGNHDYWYAFGLPDPIPPWMSSEEVEHQNWTHAQIGEGFKEQVMAWPFSLEKEVLKGKKITFQHYGLTENRDWFKPILKHPETSDLDILFAGLASEIIFYGHQHKPSDQQGKCRYVNLGSAGCYHKPELRLGILQVTGNKLSLEKLSVVYDDNGLMEAFENRAVPARDFIKKVFIVRK